MVTKTASNFAGSVGLLANLYRNINLNYKMKQIIDFIIKTLGVAAPADEQPLPTTMPTMTPAAPADEQLLPTAVPTLTLTAVPAMPNAIPGANPIQAEGQAMRGSNNQREA